MIELSVILATYNPKPEALTRTLQGLKTQTLPFRNWELVVIDNNSEQAINIDLSWHPNARLNTEPKQGLTQARLSGFKATMGDFIVMVDDDNVLNPKYLENASNAFKINVDLGAAGGRSIPEFEVSPPSWLKEFYGNLALQDVGDEISLSSWENKYPANAPIGAGMVLRRTALSAYLKKRHTISDRTGDSLVSGGDNDIVIEVLKSGWQVGYLPSLVLTHLIPHQRMTEGYIARLVNQTNRSWVQLLRSHNICPWQPVISLLVPLHKLKAWFTYQAWSRPVNYIKWRGACGLFDGLAEPIDAQ